jgi:hypothetical protein
MLVPALSFTLPIGRFGGLLVLIVIGFLLPRNRHDVATPQVGHLR